MIAPALWRDGLASGQSRDSAGNLLLGGAPAERLAQTYGTPLLVIDLDVVDAAIDTFARAAAPHNVEVSYAAKAFATTEFVAHLASREIGLDVCSLGELITAERAGFPANRLTLHGAGKSDEELRAAGAGRVGRIAVDGLDELERLARIANGSAPVDVLLRLNVGIEARTHAFVRTGGDDTKFGIHARDLPAAAAVLAGSPQLRLRGLHSHIGSQIFELDAYRANANALLEAAGRLAKDGLSIDALVIGGGYGVPSHPGAEEPPLDVAACIGTVARFVARRSAELGLPAPRLGVEPGRAIVALAGTTLYRVLARKHQTHRTFLVVDGGVAENPRPALYGARHHVLAAAPRSHDEEEVTICGRSCENDELATVSLPLGTDRGDLLAMCATGAYTYSMAGNYNRFPRPAVIGISQRTVRPLARREQLDDVLRNDAVHP